MKQAIRASLLAVMMFVSVSGWTQATTGTIAGTISDPSGAVVPGVTVVILNEDTGISRTVQTDGGGRYNAPALGLGRYKVTGSIEGFQSEARSGIELSVGRTAIVNFQLQVGAVANTVEVTGEAPLVETTRGGLGSLVDSAAIEDLPLNGRDIAQLITLQTGAVEYTGAASEGGKLLVVSGGRPTTNVFNIDGVSIESYTQKTPTGTSGSFLGQEAVREFRVETNSYSAEYGRGTGGIFNVVTKSGTNSFHGSLFETLRNDNLDATLWETNKNNLTKPEFKRNQFGGSLGGPIKKDQTHFFGTYEAYRERLGVTSSLITFSEGVRRNVRPNGAPVIPAGIRAEIMPYLTSPDLWPLPNGPAIDDLTGRYNYTSAQPTTEDLYQVRVDHKLTDNDSLFVRYTLLTSSQKRIADGGGFPGDRVTDEDRNQYSTIEWNRILTPSLLNTFRTGFNRTRPINLTTQAPINPALHFVSASGQLGDLGVTGVASVGEGVTGEFRVLNSFQFIDDVNWTKGRNTMKFGFNWNRIQFNGWNPARDAANYSFNSITNFLNATVQRFRGAVAPGFNDAYRSFRENIIAMYFQDDFRITPRLTLNLGMRYEFITVPTENYGRVANFKGDVNFMRTRQTTGVLGLTTGNPWFANPSRKNFAPRLGFAWDVDGTGRTAVRGGGGLFFMNFDQTWIRTAGFRVPPFLVEVEATINVPFPNMAALCSVQSPLITAGNPCPGRAAPDTVQQTGGNPYVMQYNMNVQRQLNSSTVVTVGYAGSRGIRLPGVADVNGYDPVEENGRLAFAPSLFTRNAAGILNVSATRPNTDFDLIRLRYPGMNSWYNSLQVNVNRKFSQGLQLGGGYTFSKNLDEISGIQTASDTESGPNSIPNYHQHGIYKGRSAFDATNVFTFNSAYELPIGRGKAIGGGMSGIADHIVGGWQLSGIMTMASGFTSTVGNSVRFTTLGNGNEQPDLRPGFSNNPTSGTSDGCNLPSRVIAPGTKLGTAELYYDLCAFAPPPERTLGNLGRNTIVMPGRAVVDLSMGKTVSFSEHKKLQVRADAFNIFNRVNLGGPDRNAFTFGNNTGFVASPTAGEITRTTGTARQIQLGLRFTF